MQITNEEKSLLAREAFKKMYSDSKYFDMSVFRNVIELFGLVIPSVTMNALSLLHCVKFAAMEIETRSWLKNTLDEIFSDPKYIGENFHPKIAGGSRGVVLSPHIFLGAN